jgi:pilus assembly protein CpaF
MEQKVRTKTSEADWPVSGRDSGPQLSVERDWKYKLHQRLLKVMDLGALAELDEAEARRQVREIAQRLMTEENVTLPAPARIRLVKELEDELLGLGPLEPLLADPHISDILVNRHDSVYIEKHGKIEQTHVQFRDDEHLLNIIDRIVSSVGRRIDESSPMVDARLKDGSRVNAVIPPLAIDGPVLSIRRFGTIEITAEKLVEIGSITPVIAKMLEGIVRGRLNVLISGGTGAGKTTMLNVMSMFIPDDERVVTIEDSAELQLQQPHVVRLETRPPNIEGKGQVTQRDLVRNSLRMRPDRIVVGEVRAGEALDMLQAMNTGHDGSITTIHANTARDALMRLENMIMMAGVNLPIKAMRAQIASAINVIIQVERMEDGRRRMVSLSEIQGMEGEVVTMSEIFRFQRTGIGDKGEVLGQFEATGQVPRFRDRLEQRGLELPLEFFGGVTLTRRRF